MALREFQDSTGREWRVWETIPPAIDGMGDFSAGWLTFDDGTDRRRLAPVPEGWAELSAARLDLLLRTADQISPVGAHARDPERRTGERRQGDRRMSDGREAPR